MLLVGDYTEPDGKGWPSRVSTSITPKLATSTLA
jgi:hypothetical protein